MRTLLLILCLGTLSSFGQLIPDPDDILSITSAPPYSAAGELFILRADTNRTLLRNPVLVVEGFDIGNEMNWPELYDLLNQETLVEDLQSYGRDLAVLNFGDSTADILANAELTAAAIEYIQINRYDPADRFIAVGASLGGLTLRKALVDLPTHQVDAWISFDGPHEGANIPLGLQEFFEHFSTVNLATFDPIRDFLQALDSPASRQLLLVHHSRSPDAPAGASAPERQDFVNAMNAAGYPANCKSIAICNGSGYGEHLAFNPGDLIIHWYHDEPIFLGPDIDADMYALPRSDDTAETVYYGRFTSLLGSASPNPKTVSSYHPLSLDNAPGGYRSSFYQVFTNLPSEYIDGDDYLTATNHCFIPTVSALGIPIDNLESNLSTHTDLLALSPFDEIHFGVTNEPHVQINARNKRWILRAVLEEHDTDGDGYDDYEEYLVGTAYDSAASFPGVYAVIQVRLVGSVAELSWDTLPNAQYEVAYADELGDPWQPLETIPPAAGPAITREYLIDSGSPSGFFRIIVVPLDPVTD
jgi:hypothetical protein